MEKIVRDAIARIDVVQNGTSASRGTGALVSDRLVLTALHVVADRKAMPPAPIPGTIRLTFPGGTTEARVLDEFMDAEGDWVLLECLTPPRVRPLPLADLNERDVNFVTYGFPDAQPTDGMVQSGRIENFNGQIFGVDAIQLFSDQAAAGNGAPVKGLSGAPLIVENALAGVIRVSLMQDQRNVAGTLYACPVPRIVDRCGELLPLPDPCRGLPGLTRRPLPATPFRFLDRFTDKDAEIFFGRNADIRSLYDRLTRDEAEPIVLLYGQSGVGKSSFLDAGVRPRLERTHEVRYVSRDPGATLLDTVQRALSGEPDLTKTAPEQFAEVWTRAEQKAGRPVIVILDEIDRAFSRPRAGNEEVAQFFRAVEALGRAGDHRPAGRLVLSFRKDWLPEVQQQLDSRRQSYSKVFLNSLDRAAIVDVVKGLTTTRRLREQYGLEMDPGLPGLIADDLLEDRSSAIAPTLQILLGKLWQEACDQDQSAPRFTEAQYQALRSKGLLLGDFLLQQLQKIRQREPALVDSGFALDVLAYHTTPRRGAEQRSRTELETTYASRAKDLRKLIELCLETYLLVDPGGDSSGQHGATRLAHDSLAPLVRATYDASLSPGQRARRVVEGRTPQAGDRERGLLDAADLRMVQRGLTGMRDLLPAEREWLRASDGRLRLRRLAVRAAVVSLVASLGWGVYELSLKMDREAQIRQPLLELGWSYAHASNPHPREIAASLAADAELDAVNEQLRRDRAASGTDDVPAGGDSRAGETALQYKPEGVDAATVIADLRKSFSVVDSGEHLTSASPAGNGGIMHAVQYGEGVARIAVQKVAYTLVRAGVTVCDISSFDNPIRQAGIIRVGVCAPEDMASPWDVARIRNFASTDVIDPLFRRLPDLRTLGLPGETLGLPSERPVGTEGSYQVFERGHALWIESENSVINILTDDGVWREFHDDVPASQDLALPAHPSAKYFNPNGGFRRIWLQHQLEALLGWPKSAEIEVPDLTLQHFAAGFMLRPLLAWPARTLELGSVLVIATEAEHADGKHDEAGQWTTARPRR